MSRRRWNEFCLRFLLAQIHTATIDGAGVVCRVKSSLFLTRYACECNRLLNSLIIFDVSYSSLLLTRLSLRCSPAIKSSNLRKRTWRRHLRFQIHKGQIIRNIAQLVNDRSGAEPDPNFNGLRLAASQLRGGGSSWRKSYKTVKAIAKAIATKCRWLATIFLIMLLDQAAARQLRRTTVSPELTPWSIRYTTGRNECDGDTASMNSLSTNYCYTPPSRNICEFRRWIRCLLFCPHSHRLRDKVTSALTVKEWVQFCGSWTMR